MCVCVCVCVGREEEEEEEGRGVTPCNLVGAMRYLLMRFR